MNRRRSLGVIGAGALGLASCRERVVDRRRRVPLAGLGVDERREIENGEEPFELRRTESGVVARSLVCPHYGCRVAWVEARRQYACPCHDGLFDADGRPVAGPPTRPLRVLPAVVEGDLALVGEP